MFFCEMVVNFATNRFQFLFVLETCPFQSMLLNSWKPPAGHWGTFHHNLSSETQLSISTVCVDVFINFVLPIKCKIDGNGLLCCVEGYFDGADNLPTTIQYKNRFQVFFRLE